MKHTRITSLRLALIVTLFVVLGESMAAAQLPGSTYDSVLYTTYQARIVTGNSATGAQTITLSAGSITLPNGRRVVPFSTSVPLTIEAGGAAPEVVTPSAVSGCYIGAASGVCTITATFSNVHGQGALVTTGDAGYAEAVLDAATNGGGAVYFTFDTGNLTLATGAATTTFAQTNFFPINAIILGVSGRVQTTITGACTGWSFGDTAAGRWIANNTGLTAGTSAVNTGPFWSTAIAVGTTGPQLAANKQLVVTCAGGNASAGVVRARVFGWTPVASAN